MNDNTILRIKVPAHLYESVKEQLTIKEAKKSGKAFGDWKVVKEKKLPKDGMEKVEEIGGAVSSNPSDMGINIVDEPGGIVTKETKEKNNEMEKKTRTLDELKAAKEKLEKKINEMEGQGDEKKITLTLNEYTGGEASYEIGQWAMQNFPEIAKALKGAASGNGQDIVDLGNTLVGLATAGTITIGTGLAMAKDSIVNAAKQLKFDPKLSAIAAKVGIKKNLKEYEVIYVVRDGKCYRKDDEGNMDEVNMSKCK